MKLLGIETSCDETAVAVVDDERRILAEHVFSQFDDHAAYGGVVPEIAARAHLEKLDRLIDRCMADAGLAFGALDAVAATAGPGLIGGLIVGSAMGKAIALAHDLPFVAVNHLEAHALTARLTDALAFPYLLLLVSGGHTQLLVVEEVGRYRRLGSTIDDAVGEAFDKTAKMLGLGYPGGPAVEAMAASGDPTAFEMPRPLTRQAGCQFSFSGLKTKVRQTILRLGATAAEAQIKADLCASFQAAVADTLCDRFAHAARLFRRQWRGDVAVIAGGVAANATLRQALEACADANGLRLCIPPQRLCTDNGVMVAWAGIERLRRGLVDPLDAAVRPRWPLDPTAEPLPGAGVKA